MSEYPPRRILVAENPTPSKINKRKHGKSKYCKYHKGEHQFEISPPPRNHQWVDAAMVCKCGKLGKFIHKDILCCVKCKKEMFRWNKRDPYVCWKCKLKLF